MMGGELLQIDEEAKAVLCKVSQDGDTAWRFISETKYRPRQRTPPRIASLPTPLRTFSYTASPDGTDSNLLLLFHGLGDSQAPFAKLGATFRLPQTAVMAVRAPFSLSLEMGHGWFEAIDLEHGGDLIRPHEAEKRRVDSLAVCLRYLDELLDALDWEPEEVFVFGFSQGGQTALEWAMRRQYETMKRPLGGIISVGAGLLEERQWRNHPRESKQPGGRAKATPALIIAGERDALCPPSWALWSSRKMNGDRCAGSEGKTEQAETSCRTVVISGKGHGMLGEACGGNATSKKVEMAAVMGFFSKHLHCRSRLEEQAGVFNVST